MRKILRIIVLCLIVWLLSLLLVTMPPVNGQSVGPTMLSTNWLATATVAPIAPTPDDVQMWRIYWLPMIGGRE